MKKLLALVLALVMTLGLATISTNAAFTDSDKINPDYATAVDLMNQLGIINGMGDGSFDPTGTLTRAQAAKIVAYMLLGADTAEGLSTANAPFADVPASHWAAPYIAFCVSQGIVNGYGDGNFGPEDKLTGHAFGKMLLVALKVDGTFTGPTWALNVAVALTKKDLDDELEDVALGNEMKREEAAQMAKNALTWADPDGDKTYKVYEDGTLRGTFNSYLEAASLKATIRDGDPQADVTIETIEADSLFSDVYDGATVKGYVVANAATGGHKVYNAPNTDLDVEHTYTTVLTENGTFYNFDAETGLDLIGHYVEVYCGTNKNGQPDEYDNDWDFGDNAKLDKEHKGTTYAVVDLSKVVTVKDELEEQTNSQVKALFGIDATDTNGNVIIADKSFVNYKLEDGAVAPITTNKTKYDLAAGDYIFVENEDTGKYELKAFSAVEDLVVAFTIERNDKTAELYTVEAPALSDDYIVEIVEDKDECTNLVGNDVKWLSYIDTDDEKNDGYGRAIQVLNVKVTGEKYTVSDLEVVSGKVTRISVSTVNETYKIYIDGKAYDFYDVQKYNVAAGITKMIEADNNNQVEIIADANRPEIISDPYDFYLDATGTVFAYVLSAESADGTLIIPVKLAYTKNWDAEDVDEYGEAKSNDEDQYSWYMQSVDTNGKEVKLDFVAEGQGIYTFLTAATQATGTIRCETKGTEKALYPNNIASAYTDPQAEKTYFTIDEGALLKFYTYKTRNISGETDTEFRDDNFKNAAVQVLTAANEGTPKDAARVKGTNFYLTSDYSVINISGGPTYGKDLKVTVSGPSASKLVAGASIYGTETSANANSFSLKYVVTVNNTSTDDLYFIADAEAGEVVSNTYTDKNGKSQTETAYEQTAYVNGTAKTILLKGNTGAAAGFYQVNEIDEYSGYYKLAAYGVNHDDVTAELYIGENNDGDQIGNNYNNKLFTLSTSVQEDLAAAKATDIEFANAKIVNTTDFDAKTITASNFTNDNYTYAMQLVLDDDGNAQYAYITKVYTSAVDFNATTTPNVYKYSGATKNADLEVFDAANATGNVVEGVVDTGKKTVTVLAGQSVEVSEKNCESRIYNFGNE